jgi:hypothetical protein
MTEVAHYTTKKAAKPTVDSKNRKKPAANLQRAETKPAPHGQRIVPVIDPAYVKKVAEELIKRTRVRPMIVCSVVTIVNEIRLALAVQEDKAMADKRTIIEYLVREGVTSDEITNLMQVRCKTKKKLGTATGTRPFELVTRQAHSIDIVSFRNEIDWRTNERKENE